MHCTGLLSVSTKETSFCFGQPSICELFVPCTSITWRLTEDFDWNTAQTISRFFSALPLWILMHKLKLHQFEGSKTITSYNYTSKCHAGPFRCQCSPQSSILLTTTTASILFQTISYNVVS